jgi:hypothetical protein
MTDAQTRQVVGEGRRIVEGKPGVKLDPIGRPEIVSHPLSHRVIGAPTDRGRDPFTLA